MRDDSADTPMMRQYRAAKRDHPDAILLFRMGDFYEMFEEDAVVASKLLGLTLTTRDKGKPQPVPMAGMPWHSAESYIGRLVRAGLKVTICEQVEDPRKAKGLVRREVTEIVTPGTVLSDALLARERDSFLAAIFPNGERVGIAALALSSGEFWVSECASSALAEEIDLAAPVEILLPDSLKGKESAIVSQVAQPPAITWVESWKWGEAEAVRALAAQFRTAGIDGFGIGHLPLAIRCAGVVLLYLTSLGREHLEHITRITERRRASHLILDDTTRKHLEILEPAGASAAVTSLAGSVDRTRTAMGARLLRRWLGEPLARVDEIRERHASVREMVERRTMRPRLRDALRGVRDLERAAARLVCEKGTPRDLVAIAACVRAAAEVHETIAVARSPLFTRLCAAWDPCLDVAATIESAIEAEPPATAREPGVIREGWSEELDQIRAVLRDGKAWVVAYQDRERERTGIATLKVGFNRVFGYYIEVTRPHRDRVPSDYMRKQTLANAERFVTEELSGFEARILDAEERVGALEESLFVTLRKQLAKEGARLAALASALATADLVSSFAELAVERGYVEPVIDDGTAIEIVQARHPVLERLLPPGDFIANDLSIDTAASQIHLITGPNMAGKSTFLRQTALVVVLAQAGSFVPAASARIGVVDRIFTRIGARDDLARGQSTFLVEMIETARILHQATPKSLILLDEVGRGTSTFDGLSIAWAVVEQIHETPAIAARTLFATHYHELTDLALTLPRVRNFHVEVREWEGGIVFLRRIVPGGTDRSYGIHVAELAGLPRSVIRRAREVLRNLEAGELGAEGLPLIAQGAAAPRPSRATQLPLLAAAPPPESAVEREIRDLEIEAITPLAALERLAAWKRRLEEESA
jgi:DNA mismatch repair protein MutS